MIEPCEPEDEIDPRLTAPDGLFDFPTEKQAVTIQEAARAFRVADQKVRGWIDEGLLVAVAINDKKKVLREHLRISRFSAVALWREQIVQRGLKEPKFFQNPLVIWWRNELRARKGLPRPMNWTASNASIGSALKPLRTARTVSRALLIGKTPVQGDASPLQRFKKNIIGQIFRQTV